MKMGSIYSATDKALFDAINNSAVTSGDLREFFLIHGIIISPRANRKDLALHYSRLIHDHYDFKSLAKLFETDFKKERNSSLRIDGNLEISNFEDAAHDIADLIKKDTDSAVVTKQLDGSIKLYVRYKTYNPTKSEFKQVEVRSATITIEKENDEIVIRGEQNKKVDSICKDIIAHVSKATDSVLNIDEISLETITSAAKRTEFFVNLINNLDGYSLHTVTDVFVFKTKDSKSESLDDEDIDSTDDDFEIDDKDSDLGIHIQNASLKGQGVLESEQFQSLVNSDSFYISKIVWQAKTSQIDSDIYEFEAQFSEPETCTRFSYLIKGFYKYIDQKNFTKSRQSLEISEEKLLNKILESSARTSLSQISIIENPTS